MQTYRQQKIEPEPQRGPIPAFTPIPISTSTPPVRIIDSEPRLSGGPCLVDR